MALNRIYCATGLTGYTDGKLDTIDGADLSNGDMAIVFDTGTVYFYKMNTSGGAAESSPTVIVPDDNNDSGNKNWELQSMYVNDITIADDIILATDDVKIGDTLEVVGATQFGDADGTGAGVTFYSNTAGDFIVYDPAGKTFTLTDIQLVAGSVDINGGAIDGTAIGAASASTIVGTTIDASTDFTIGDTVITDGAITDATGLSIAATTNFNDNAMTNVNIDSGDMTGVTISGALTWSSAQNLNSQALTNANIDSGAIDGVTLGATSACTFTSLTSANLGQISWGDGIPDANSNMSGPVTIEATVDQNTVGATGCLVLSSDGNWDDADKDAEATVGQLAMAVDSGTGASKTLMLQGFVTNTGWAFTPGAQLFVSDSGAITATVPSASGDFIQVVGYAITATSIYFNPSPDYMEIA